MRVNAVTVLHIHKIARTQLIDLHAALRQLVTANDTRQELFGTCCRLSQHIGLCSVLRPRQHSRPIGYMGDGLVAKDTSTVAKCSNNQLSSVLRLHQRRFLQVKRPNQQYQSSEGTHTRGWLP